MSESDRPSLMTRRNQDENDELRNDHEQIGEKRDHLVLPAALEPGVHAKSVPTMVATIPARKPT
jgi:hypothetical protein